MNNKPAFPIVATDQRFLAPHPRTVEWLEQRKTCERCKHCADSGHNNRNNPLGIRCWKTPQMGSDPYAYCIDAREPGQPCGSDAVLFEQKD